MPCEHDREQYGLMGLPKEANGCLACHAENLADELKSLKRVKAPCTACGGAMEFHLDSAECLLCIVKTYHSLKWLKKLLLNRYGWSNAALTLYLVGEEEKAKNAQHCRDSN